MTGVTDDHGQPHPRSEFRADIAEFRADAQDRRQIMDELVTDDLSSCIANLSTEVRWMIDRVEVLVELVAEMTRRGEG